MKLADGIYAFIAPEATGAFVSGNSVLIVGGDGVLVLTPAMSRASPGE